LSTSSIPSSILALLLVYISIFYLGIRSPR
jgi:hypothetical protein